MHDEHETLETVATFTDLTRAQSARSALEAAGIASALLDENTGSMDWGLMPAMGGLRLQVKSVDIAQAQEVLAESGMQPDDTGEGTRFDLADPEEVEHRASASRRKRRVGLVAFLIFFLPTLLAFVVMWLGGH